MVCIAQYFGIRKDIMIEKIGYELFVIVASIFILILFILLLFGRLYMIVSVGLSFSISYSNSFFTKLALALMSYFLAQVFDKEALISRIVKNLDENLKESYQD
jgi:hypothetical protein